jgi:hypothetical protein
MGWKLTFDHPFVPITSPTSNKCFSNGSRRPVNPKGSSIDGGICCRVPDVESYIRTNRNQYTRRIFYSLLKIKNIVNDFSLLGLHTLRPDSMGAISSRWTDDLYKPVTSSVRHRCPAFGHLDFVHRFPPEKECQSRNPRTTTNVHLRIPTVVRKRETIYLRERTFNSYGRDLT